MIISLITLILRLTKRKTHSRVTIKCVLHVNSVCALQCVCVHVQLASRCGVSMILYTGKFWRGNFRRIITDEAIDKEKFGESGSLQLLHCVIYIAKLCTIQYIMLPR